VNETSAVIVSIDNEVTNHCHGCMTIDITISRGTSRYLVGWMVRPFQGLIGWEDVNHQGTRQACSVPTIQSNIFIPTTAPR
jgi:hypothetical protein